MLIKHLEQVLDASGLCLRGGFHPAEADGVPLLEGGIPVGTLLMVGNAGPAMWRRFTAERPAGPSPLDTWTRQVLTRVADRFGCGVVYPFQHPFLPFQTWAMRAEPCHVSPIAILIHPDFGLWHALRGALLFAPEIRLPEPARPASACDTCRDRACLTTCPVGAFSGTGYDVAACLAHLDDPAGGDCIALGCRARRACPVGGAYRYAPAQARFHMEAFRRIAAPVVNAPAP